ncbi:peptidoglycan-binding protein [Rhizobium sp. YIM 134829]|uniref:peptidoglycan-binding domain-containing protein n=1 Tax=Rhizobium sp. YIM 134829 TaxID=3390453 RepID=UPI003979AF52
MLRTRRSMLLRACAALFGLAARNPAVFGGSAAFAIIFGFVAANALWYQPGAHPSPLMRTRLPFTHPNPASLNPSTKEPQTGKVTTFVIEREADVAKAPETSIESVIAADGLDEPAAPAATGEQTASLQPASRAPAALPPARLAAPTMPQESPLDEEDLVRAVQISLIARGFYDGPADGRPGPKTSAAIRAYERASGLPETGAPTPALRVALAQAAPQRQMAAVTPAERPSVPKPSRGELDPVAAAIRAADGASLAVPKADVPASDATVMAIQRGLKNLAYTEVRVDGMAGEQTRAAIRHFEKHYRLPETGEPNPAVLKKMKEIGAL